MPSPTLIKPPPDDPSKAPIENVTALTSLFQIGPDIYTNTRQLWHPPGARGIYGGAVIAQCLSAAQATVPPPGPANDDAVFLPHSMHCYFVLAGDTTIPILYHVERVRDGRSFLTRTVQARQRGKCIFTTTISFAREGSGGTKVVEHGWDMPAGVREELQLALKAEESQQEQAEKSRMGIDPTGPFIAKRLGIQNYDAAYPQLRKPHSWVRCRGKITGGIDAHLSALAYMSDSWFIGTTSRIHKINSSLSYGPRKHSAYLTRPLGSLEDEDNVRGLEEGLVTNTKPTPPGAKIGMMVSLDHTIYFHRPRDTRADEWLCSEMESPWMGEGRGLVYQRIWTQDGRLIASCVQEGVTRLVQDKIESKL